MQTSSPIHRCDLVLCLSMCVLAQFAAVIEVPHDDTSIPPRGDQPALILVKAHASELRAWIAAKRCTVSCSHAGCIIICTWLPSVTWRLYGQTDSKRGFTFPQVPATAPCELKTRAQGKKHAFLKNDCPSDRPKRTFASPCAFMNRPSLCPLVTFHTHTVPFSSALTTTLKVELYSTPRTCESN